MGFCNSAFVKGGCDGHLGKYEDCLAEALDSAGLDYADDDTGSCEFEGHLFLFLFEASEQIDVDHDGKRIAMVPAGNYVLFTAPTGYVLLWKYETAAAAKEEFAAWAERYAIWDKGCEQTGHEACEEHDECILGGTPGY